MRVAVLGQGSIGRRHAKLARELGHEPIVYDPDPNAAQSQERTDAPPQAHTTTTTQPQAHTGAPHRTHTGAPPHTAASARACVEGADAAIVASPSSEHLAHARMAIELGVPVLVEKPLALSAAGAAELVCLAERRRVLLSVAMNLREHPGVAALSALMAEGAIGGVLRASAWCGSWLPGWRPATDYRNGYSARAELGGGVLRDVAVHELDYLLELVGPARSVSALASRVSALETDVEDVALIAMELERGGFAEVGVDYFDRAHTRGCRIVGSEGTLQWSWESGLLRLFDARGLVEERVLESNVAPTYRTQLARFLEAARTGGPAPVSAISAQRVLAVLDAARLSAREGRRISLAPILDLRAAEEGDSARLLAWRNDPDTRRASRDAHEIAPEEHARWMARTREDPASRLWVLECEGRPVAHVRADLDDGEAELHIVVAPHVRGRGLGQAALTRAAAQALAEPGVGLLRAHVKPHNLASLGAFARAGFEMVGSDARGLVRLERACGPVDPPQRAHSP